MLPSRHFALPLGLVALIGLLVLLTGHPAPTHAQEPSQPSAPAGVETIPLLSDVGGGVTAVAVQGNYAYIALGERLAIQDVSDPANPSLVGQTDVLPTFFIPAVAVSGNYAYVALSGLMQIVDVSDPTTPQLRGTFELADVFDLQDVVVRGDFLYLADNDLHILDVSDPDAPTQVGYLNTPGLTRDIALAGDYVYLADGTSGMRVVDISDPEVPTLVANYSRNGTLVAFGIAVAGDYAYVAGEWQGIHVLDISTPGVVTYVGSYDTPERSRDVVVDGNSLYSVESYGGLRVLDVSNPAALRLVASQTSRDYSVDVAVADGRAYVADSRGGLRIFQQSATPTPAPVEVGSWETSAYTYGVDVQGEYAYVADGDRLRVLDISDPTNPQETGSVALPGTVRNVVVDLRGEYAYVAAREAGLRVIDVRDPAAPEEVGFLDTPGSAEGVAIAFEGEYVYVADGSSGFRSIRITTPTAPEEVAFVDTPGTAYDVVSNLLYAYVTDGSAGVRIIDVFDPAVLTDRGALDTPGEALGVALQSDFNAQLYVADGADGLRLYDENFGLPVARGSQETPGYALSVVFARDFLYIADGRGGLRVLDAGGRPPPAELGSVDTPDYAYDVAVQGNYAYVADGSGGIRVISTATTLPVTLAEVGDITKLGSPEALTVVDDYLYLAAPTGLHIYDLTGAAPVQVGHLETGGNPTNVTIVGDYAYIGNLIVDVSDPAAPEAVGTYELLATASDSIVVGNYAYLAKGGRLEYNQLVGEGLAILDVSNPAAPRQVAFFPTQDSATGVTVVGDYAYLADVELLHIINISDPLNPIQESQFATPGGAYDVVVVGDYAYIADGSAQAENQGFFILDISDPAAPQGRGSARVRFGVSVATDGTNAYVFDLQGGLNVFDVSDADAPTPIATYSSPEMFQAFGNGQKLALVEDRIYVAGGNAGLLTLLYESAVPTAVTLNTLAAPAAPSLMAWLVAVGLVAATGGLLLARRR